MTDTTMNTGAASLSDERERAAITACALMIKGICLTRPNAEWTGAIEDRIQFMLKQMQAGAAIAAGGAQEVAQSWIDGVAAELWAVADVSGFDDFKLAVGGFLIATALPRVAATVALTDEQREAIEWAAGRAHVEALGKPIGGAEGKRWRLLSDMFRAAASNGEQA